MCIFLVSWTNSPYRPVVLNLFAEPSQIRLTTLLDSRVKEILNKSSDKFCFVAERSLLHKMLEVLLKDC